jgi:hypothetical protein
MTPVQATAISFAVSVLAVAAAAIVLNKARLRPQFPTRTWIWRYAGAAVLWILLRLLEHRP